MKFHFNIVVTILLFIIFVINYVQSSGLGRCPNYPSMPKFNMTKFLGTWFEIERSFYLPEIAFGCTTLTFNYEELKSDQINRNLDIAVKSINQWTGSPSINLGIATPESEKSSIMDFKFTSRLPDIIARFLPGAGRYQILYTDYNNFAILYSCSGIVPIGYTDQMWLLGRERIDFTLEIRQIIYDALTQLSLDSDRLILSKNKNCSNAL